MPDLLEFMKLGSPTHTKALEEAESNRLIQLGGYYTPGAYIGFNLF